MPGKRRVINRYRAKTHQMSGYVVPRFVRAGFVNSVQHLVDRFARQKDWRQVGVVEVTEAVEKRAAETSMDRVISGRELVDFVVAVGGYKVC